MNGSIFFAQVDFKRVFHRLADYICYNLIKALLQPCAGFQSGKDDNCNTLTYDPLRMSLEKLHDFK